MLQQHSLPPPPGTRRSLAILTTSSAWLQRLRIMQAGRVQRGPLVSGGALGGQTAAWHVHETQQPLAWQHGR